MSEERRQRLQERLRRKWLNKNARRKGFDQKTIEEIRELEHIEHVVVHDRIHFSMRLDKKTIMGSVDSVVAQEPKTLQRVIAGQSIDPDDDEGILLSEYTAYDFGFRTDVQLESLIGREIEVSMVLGADEFAYLAGLASEFGDANKSTMIIDAFRKMIKELDSTKLSNEEKKAIRQAFKNINTKKPTRKIVFRRKLVIRGIVFRRATKEFVFRFSGSLPVADARMFWWIIGNLKSFGGISTPKNATGNFMPRSTRSPI